MRALAGNGAEGVSRMLSLASRAFLIVALGSSPLWAGDAKDRTEKSKFEISEEEQKLVDLTNEARQKEKLPPLKPNKTLFAVARAHSANMARQNQMNHVLDGKSPGQRIKASGYAYSSFGENIAFSMGWSLAQVMDGWMKSPGHRANILRKEYREIGIGIATNEDNKTYYTQVFGTQRKR
jgi:uncharacterized protein YkwD